MQKFSGNASVSYDLHFTGTCNRPGLEHSTGMTRPCNKLCRWLHSTWMTGWTTMPRSDSPFCYSHSPQVLRCLHWPEACIGALDAVGAASAAACRCNTERDAECCPLCLHRAACSTPWPLEVKFLGLLGQGYRHRGGLRSDKNI